MTDDVVSSLVTRRDRGPWGGGPERPDDFVSHRDQEPLEQLPDLNMTLSSAKS